MQVDGKSSVERRIAGAFKAAADATGTSFDYLLATSKRESDHRPDLAADGSSAKGLFQFVDQTWFELVRREGPSVGLERFADKIRSDGKGGWTVPDPVDRAKILSLRTDPLVSAVMAGKFTQDNTRRLTETLGRAPSDGELYAAHVLGPAGATRLFRLAAGEPNTAAVVAFPKAASANPGLFYRPGGQAVSVGDLFARLTRMPDGDGDPATARIAAAHRNLTASGSKTDPATVALLLRAQAAAVVGEDKLGVPTATPTAADRRLVETALGETGLPGASDTVEAGRLDGWRARVVSDAFAGLMRDDAATPQAAAAFAASRTLPGLSGGEVAKTALAAARTGTTGSVPHGAVARVDPFAPMSLAATPTSPSLAALDREVPEPTRSSRYASAAAGGAPAAPLPMVDAARGATRPSRLLFADWTVPSEEALAAGVVRVRTTAIPVSPAAGGAVRVASAGFTAPAAEAAPHRAGGAGLTGRRRMAPLDLFALARGGGGTDRGQ